MAESARSNEADRTSRFIVRLFIVVLAFLLLLSGYDHYAPLVFGNNKPLTEGGSAGMLFFRDLRIDRLKPVVTQMKDSAFTAEEITAAVNLFKAHFKQQKIEYGLCAVRFDEAASRRMLSRLPQPESGERYLALLCDYNVYDDTESGDKKGYYANAVFLLQEEADGSWQLLASAEQSRMLALISRTQAPSCSAPLSIRL